MVRSFPIQTECEARRANPWERCVASDAPRLKKIVMREPREVVRIEDLKVGTVLFPCSRGVQTMVTS
jgi:hypothetical protein